MTITLSPKGSPARDGGAAPADAIEARLRETALQLQGVFVQQLFQAMRETVPSDDPLVAGGLGEDIFRGMFDEHVAGSVPAALDRANGLTDAIVRQLRARVQDGGSSRFPVGDEVAARAADTTSTTRATGHAEAPAPASAPDPVRVREHRQENPK